MVVHARKINLIEGYGVRGGERYTSIAFKRFSDYLAARSLNDQEVKLLVHVPISRFVCLDKMPLGKNLIAFPEAFVEGMDEPARRSLFSEHSRRQALKRASNIDRIHDL